MCFYVSTDVIFDCALMSANYNMCTSEMYFHIKGCEFKLWADNWKCDACIELKLLKWDL